MYVKINLDFYDYGWNNGINKKNNCVYLVFDKNVVQNIPELYNDFIKNFSRVVKIGFSIIQTVFESEYLNYF